MVTRRKECAELGWFSRYARDCSNCSRIPYKYLFRGNKGKRGDNRAISRRDRSMCHIQGSLQFGSRSRTILQESVRC